MTIIQRWSESLCDQLENCGHLVVVLLKLIFEWNVRNI